MSRSVFADHNSDCRRKRINELLSFNKPDSAVDRCQKRVSLAFKLRIPKLRVHEDQEVGASRIAFTMASIGEFNSCAVLVAMAPEGDVFYQVMVCFKEETSLEDVQRIFFTADVSPILGYKAAFFNFMFGIDEKRTDLTCSTVFYRKAFGDFNCDLESVSH